MTCGVSLFTPYNKYPDTTEDNHNFGSMLTFPCSHIHVRAPSDLRFIVPVIVATAIVSFSYRRMDQDWGLLTQSFPNGNNIAFNNHRLAHRNGPQVGHIQRPAHADKLPEIRLRDGNQRCRGGDIEDGGGASAVQVPQAIGMARLAGIFKYHPPSWLGRGGDDLQVRSAD